MSEFQCYKFKTIDRPLTSGERKEVDALSSRGHVTSIPFNIARKTGKSYDLATETLKDLKALAEYQGKTGAFREKMLELKKEYSRRPALIERWEQAGLFR